jgi:hypothetical protein
MSKHRRSLAVAALLAISALLVGACAAQSSPSGGATAGPAGFAIGAPAPAVPGVAVGEQAAARPGGGDASQSQTVPIPQAFETDRKLILSASVSMRAKDPWNIADRVQAIALGSGGDVMSLSQSGSGEHKAAALTVRVPQERFNDVLRQVRAISEVEVISSNVEGKDVTDQFVDLEARLKAKQAEEQRYVALLARANTVEEILRIDQVLAQVRTQIEQLTAQLNSLKARTTFSTITVQVTPIAPAPVPTADPRAYDPSQTLERAVAALASVLRVAVDAAIWALVFGWIPLMVFGVALLVSRTRARAMPSA